MKLNPPLLSRCCSVTFEGKQLSTVFLLSQVASLPAVRQISSRSDFIHESGFIPQKADLVEKDSELYPILSLFLVRMTGERAKNNYKLFLRREVNKARSFRRECTERRKATMRLDGGTFKSREWRDSLNGYRSILFRTSSKAEKQNKSLNRTQSSIQT